MTETSIRFGALGAIAMATLLVASSAEAHAHLVKSNPAENAIVAAPPALHMEFSEKLEAKFSGADLMKSNGATIASKAKVDAKTIDVSPSAALAPGGYMVMWHAVSDDGHKSKGQFSFTVK